MCYRIPGFGGDHCAHQEAFGEKKRGQVEDENVESTTAE
jgi:hypothetical protein